MNGRLEAVLRRLGARRRGADAAGARRVRIEERLRALERDVSEIKARLNGLLFTVVGALAAEVVTRWLT
ncbi:MAG TPA: hypothetical protein VNM43_00240 [Dehalococcoidia bacterium]|nr:hypothetical protein [Dehalococcoidia bacterium]